MYTTTVWSAYRSTAPKHGRWEHKICEGFWCFDRIHYANLASNSQVWRNVLSPRVHSREHALSQNRLRFVWTRFAHPRRMYVCRVVRWFLMQIVVQGLVKLINQRSDKGSPRSMIWIVLVPVAEDGRSYGPVSKLVVFFPLKSFLLCAFLPSIIFDLIFHYFLFSFLCSGDRNRGTLFQN